MDFLANRCQSPIRIFTFLGSNVYFSLFDKVLTLYPQGFLLCSVTQTIQLIEDVWDKLKNKKVLYHSHPLHELFHKDGLSSKHWHTHIEFDEALDEHRLNIVLHEFVLVSLISLDEKKQCINSYRQVNPILVADITDLQLNEFVDKMVGTNPIKSTSYCTINQLKIFIPLIDNHTEQLSRDFYDSRHHDAHMLSRYTSCCASTQWKALGATLVLLSCVLALFSNFTLVSRLPREPREVPLLGTLGLFATGVASIYKGMQMSSSRQQESRSLLIESKLESIEHVASYCSVV